MPLFDYQCTACGHEFEALQRMSEGPLIICPNCGQDKLKKKVAAPAFTFKGDGWYKDLYGSSKSGKDESASGSDTNKSAEKKTDGASPAKKESSNSSTSKGESKKTTTPSSKDS